MASIVFERVGKRYADGHQAIRALDLTIPDGEFLVLVGPSGCGKSTALRMIAGLEEISEGRLLIDGAVANHLAPRDRDVAMVFQSYALYPHMTVAQNIGFGLSARGASKAEISAKVSETAKLLELEDHLARKPGELSGGQRQRVAMGRAIARRPKAFLMDEPLSNLDARLRGHMRSEIARIQKLSGATTVYVTHDQIEAMTMGDRVAAFRGGVLQQAGPPRSLYDTPANLFIAGFIGAPTMNFIRAKIEASEEGVVAVAGQFRLPLTPARLAASPGLQAYAGSEVMMGVRPRRCIQEAPTGRARWRASSPSSRILAPPTRPSRRRKCRKPQRDRDRAGRGRPVPPAPARLDPRRSTGPRRRAPRAERRGRTRRISSTSRARMPSTDVVAGLDIGTTSTIAVVMTARGEVLGSASRPCALFSPEPGFAEADPAEWWANACATLKEAIRAAGVAPRAICVTGMLPAVVALDGDGRPLRRSLQQSDARAPRGRRDAGPARRSQFPCPDRTGHHPAARRAETAWIAAHEPQIFERIAHVVGSYDYINYRLTGRLTVERNWGSGGGFRRSRRPLN